MGRVRSFVSMMRGAGSDVAGAAGSEGANGGVRAIGGITAMGVAGAALDGTLTYAGERAANPDGSQAAAAAKGALTGAGWLFAAPLMWGITLGGAAVGGGKMMYDEAKRNVDQKKSINLHVTKDATGSNGGQIGGTFVDNEAAHTMRQRQMNLLKNHKMSTESILGSEARQLHR